MVLGRIEQLTTAIFDSTDQLRLSLAAHIRHINAYARLPAIAIHKGTYNAVKVVLFAAAIC
jgi:hypothetical protein